MQAHLKNLISLQTVDNQLIEINELKGDLPQIVSTLNQEIDTLKMNLSKEMKRDEVIDNDMTKDRNDIEDFKVNLKKYEEQLYLVTSNKEYDALTSEIDNVKQHIDKSEYNILELENEKATLLESIKSNKLTYEEKQKELSKRKKQLDQTNKQTDKRVEELERKRESLMKSIPLRWTRQYERIAKAKSGIAIVSVEQAFDEKKDKKGNIEYIPGQAFCGGCHKIVPPQKLVEVRLNKQILRCEFCGRFLYWDESSNSVSHIKDEEII